MKSRNRPRAHVGEAIPLRPLAVLVAIGLLACAPTTPVPRQATGSATTVRVAMAEPAYHGLDPQAAWTDEQFELLRCCLVRTLMTYRGAPQFAGTQPVPDLATEPPSVSADGMTWTFHLRRGISYAPPMDDIEVTSADIVRALLRAGSGEVGNAPGEGYLGLIEGFAPYAAGEADAIAGVSTPDPHTIRIRTTRPDRSVAHIFAMAFTSPIPPSPSEPAARLGVATGHPFASTFEGGPPDDDGYGPFLVATGPYMMEGAGQLDPSAAPDDQDPVAGFTPGWWFDDPGSLVLVRNPSWDASTDPNRPALADRIEISIAPAADPYVLLEEGSTDVVMGADPSPDVAERYRASEETQDRVVVTEANFTAFAGINVAQPPFDDVHVRRAVALALDPTSLQALMGTPAPAAHLIPDPMIGSLLSSWGAHPDAAAGGDRVAARAEMNASSYGVDGMCAGAACSGVKVRLLQEGPGTERASESIRASLASIGLRATFVEEGCEPQSHVAMCVGGWITDYPDASNMVSPFLSSFCSHGFCPTMLGASPEDLGRWGYPTRRVPSIDEDYERCAASSGVNAALCWARLDQMLTSSLAAIVPIGFGRIVRIHGLDVSAYSLSQAFGEPALERVAVTRPG